MTRIVSVLTCAGIIVTALYTTAGAQAPTRSVTEGVYTAEQAMRGEPIYKEQCAMCHGDNLEGSGPMPPLVGVDFAMNWQGKTVADLFEKTHSSMPATAPGSLSEKQVADILAYMFSMANHPAGTMELDSSVEPLKQISLDAK